jgi:hypothetical protein
VGKLKGKETIMEENYQQKAAVHYISTLQTIQSKLGTDGKRGLFRREQAGLSEAEMQVLRELTMYLPTYLEQKAYRPIDLRQSALLLQQIQTRHNGRLAVEEKQVLQDIVLILVSAEHPTDAPEPS